MQQTASMTIAASLFASQMHQGIAGLSGVTFRLDHPVFGAHIYKIIGAEQNDPENLNLRCVVLGPWVYDKPTLGT